MTEDYDDPGEYDSNGELEQICVNLLGQTSAYNAYTTKFMIYDEEGVALIAWSSNLSKEAISSAIKGIIPSLIEIIGEYDEGDDDD